MFAALGRLVLRLRYLAILIWVVAALVAYTQAPSLSVVGSADETSFLPSDAQSLAARQLVDRAFPSDASAATATLVFERDGGLTDADRTYIRDLGAWLTAPDAPEAIKAAVSGFISVDQNSELASMYRSPDGAVELATVKLKVISFQPESNAGIDAMRAHIAATNPPGLTTSVTGQAGIGRDYVKAIQDGTDRTTLATVVLVVVILLLIYRAPLAALVPLLTIGAAYLVSRGLLGELAAQGWKLSSITDSFIVVLVFGVGTDYTIFLISRFREELGRADPEHAIPITVSRIAAVITASAATVIVGLGSMVIGRFGMIQTIGPALALTIFVTLLAGLTLTPALLSIFGHHLFWPLHEHRRPVDDEQGFWAALARRITLRPGLVSIAVLAVLLVPLIGLADMRSNFDPLSELPKTADSRQGFDALASHLDKGQLLPLSVLVDVPAADLSTPASLANLRATTDRLAAVPGVEKVRSIVEPAGDGTVPSSLQPSAQLADLAVKLTPSGDPEAARKALLKPDATAGMDNAGAYLDALGRAFPDVAGSAALKTPRAELGALSDAIRQLQSGARVNGQLRALAAAVGAFAQQPAVAPGSPAAAAQAAQAAAQLRAIAGYLQELVTAYPDVASEPSLRDAAATIAELQSAPTPALLARLATDLEALGGVFDARPDAMLLPKSLPATPASIALSQRIGQLSAALPGELRSLGSTFAAREDDYFVPADMSGDTGSQAKAALDAYVSAGRDVARLYVTVASDPYSTTAFDTVHRLRAALAAGGSGGEGGPGDAATYGGSARLLVGGATAEFADIQTTISDDFGRVALITIVGILLVLMLLLRSVVAPIYLVLTVLLSYGATLGLSSLIFQRILGEPGLNYFIPLMVFVLLVALGSDYNIFLMSRVREESATRGLRPGIRFASARTGTVITSAGIILAGTFAALATAPLNMLIQVGVTVAMGVLIDTFLVRSLLVPALTALLGDAAWWPFHVRMNAVPAGAGAGDAGPAGAVPASVRTGVARATVAPVPPAVAVSASAGAAVAPPAPAVPSPGGASLPSLPTLVPLAPGRREAISAGSRANGHANGADGTRGHAAAALTGLRRYAWLVPIAAGTLGGIVVARAASIGRRGKG